MTSGIILAGFGGQGIMTMGTILAAAGMREGKNVTWLPSYGAEQRGGTANCTVVISEEMIASPIVDRPGLLAAMNAPSLDKFEPRVAEGGLIFINSSLVGRGSARRDVREYMVPANELAEKLGNVKVANMIMLGALVSQTRLVRLSTIQDYFRESSKGRSDLLKLNLAALQAGSGFITR